MAEPADEELLSNEKSAVGAVSSGFAGKRQEQDLAQQSRAFGRGVNSSPRVKVSRAGGGVL